MQAMPELKQMTLPEKLQLMEALWDDLCGREEDVPVAARLRAETTMSWTWIAERLVMGRWRTARNATPAAL